MTVDTRSLGMQSCVPEMCKGHPLLEDVYKPGPSLTKKDRARTVSSMLFLQR